MLLQELHIYSEQSSSNTKVSIKNKDGEILFEYCYSNDAIPTFNPIELLRLSLEGDIGVLFQMQIVFTSQFFILFTILMTGYFSQQFLLNTSLIIKRKSN